ncbi:hypothetical protein ES288_A04G141300v1, partial [Gossypium darwinii]
RLRPTKQSPPTVRARRAMSPSPSLLSFSSCCGSEWKGTIDHVSNVARWMSARRGRARDVRCLGTASIAAAEGMVEHVSNVAWWMSARRGRASDVWCLGIASIAAATEGWLLGVQVYFKIGFVLNLVELGLRVFCFNLILV